MLHYSKILTLTVSALALMSCGGGGSGGGNTGGGGGGSANVAPTFTGATSFTFAENQPVTFQLTVTDPDSATVTITDDTTGDGALFSVNTDGEVNALTADGSFNFEMPQDVNGDNVYEQSITLSDGTASTTTTITVTITDVDEQPGCEPLVTINFNENTSGVIGNLAAASSDPEGAAITGYTLGSVGRTTNVEQETLDQFTLNTTTGDVSLTSALDAEKVGVEGTFTVESTTSYGAQSVSCTTNFQIVDVEGDVVSGVKFKGEIVRLEAIGDVNNDTFTDFVISERVIDANGDVKTPLAHLIFGSTIVDALVDDAEEVDLSDVTSDFVFTGQPQTNDAGDPLNYRYLFSPLGDLDGDDLDEFSVAIEIDKFADDLPVAVVVWGDGLAADADNSLDLTALSPSEGLELDFLDTNHSRLFTSFGDMDGNGTSDLLVGLPFGEITPPTVGLDLVIFGETLNAAKAAGSLDLKTLTPAQGVNFSSDNPSESYGGRVSTAGDINGDGADELLAHFSSGFDIVTSQEIINTANGPQGGAPDRLNVSTNSTAFPSQTKGDSDGDGRNDVLFAVPYPTSAFATIVFAAQVNAAMPDETIFAFGNDVIKFTATDGFTTLASAHYLGDWDGDNLDEVFLKRASTDGENALYVIKGSALVGLPNNTLDVSTLISAQGLKIIDSGEVDLGNFNISILRDSDGDNLPDIGIAGALNQTLGYIIRSADIKTTLDAGTTQLDIQDLFNDETP